MGVVGWLRDKDGMAGALDEVVSSDICHDLRAGQDLRMEFLLDLADLLRKDISKLSHE